MSTTAAPAEAAPPVAAPLPPQPAPAPAPSAETPRPKTIAEFDAQCAAEAAALEARAAEIVSQIAPAIAPAAPEETSPETPVEAAPETPPTEDPAPAAPEETPKRVRLGHLSEADRAQVVREVEVLRELKAIAKEAGADDSLLTLADARAKIEEQDAEAAARAEIEAEEHQAAAAPIAARDARIAEIRAEIKKMAEEQSLITPEYLALQEELEQLRDEQREARQDQQQRARDAQEASVRAYREDHARTLREYPSANKTSEPLGKIVEQLISDWKQKRDPRWNPHNGVSNVVKEAVSILEEMGVPPEVIRHGRGAPKAAPKAAATAPASVPKTQPPSPVASPAKAGGPPGIQIQVGDLLKAKSTKENLALIDKALGFSDDDSATSIRGGFSIGG